MENAAARSDGISDRQCIEDWWRTSITEMRPGVIRYRGYSVAELIGQVSFSEMVWLMTRGELPSGAQAALLDAALMSAVDHGPAAPSLAIARMAATCGIGLNGAMASAVNVLGDIHGGAGEQAMTLYLDARERLQTGASLESSVASAVDAFIQEHGPTIPGFGHRFHPVDPRSGPLMSLVQAAALQGTVDGGFVTIARGIEALLRTRKGKAVPMNIDGATAVIYAELGFKPPLARGLFCLSRSVGILAHAWEQSQREQRIKGSMPKRFTPSYDGPPPRPLEKGR